MYKRQVNNRQNIFENEEDMARILSDIKESLTKADCHLHAYVIITNHVHLFVSTEHEGAISKIKHFDTTDCVIDLGME